MNGLNSKRIVLGAVTGGFAWIVWSGLINTVFLGQRYVVAQDTGTLLSESRYGFFLPVYFLSLLAISFVLAWLYAGVRTTFGPGPGTALKLGAVVGFAIAFPLNFSTASWVPVSRFFPLMWMLELWVGAILAAVIAGWFYYDD
ncbi:MAG: hypothetical protein K8R59_04250 [Thermoanaerobaculales bacterium]|nr:hypothetical protein [Thermoanaerobaculales bacterium]